MPTWSNHSLKPLPPGTRFPVPGPETTAGWSSPVARQAHNLKVRGSNPLPATNPIKDLATPYQSADS